MPHRPGRQACRLNPGGRELPDSFRERFDRNRFRRRGWVPLGDPPGAERERSTLGARKRTNEMKYSESMKARMIKRMTGPRATSATALSAETGIAQATLSRWLRAAGTVGGMSKQKRQLTRSKRTQDWTVPEKLSLVTEAASLPEDELGAFLRRKGLHREQLERWREAAMEAFEAPSARGRRKRGPSPEQKRIRELERELRRKERALAEAAALLVLKKKFETAFGDEDSDMDPRNDG